MLLDNIAHAEYPVLLAVCAAIACCSLGEAAHRMHTANAQDHWCAVFPPIAASASSALLQSALLTGAAS
jgi:hypothetical protein